MTTNKTDSISTKPDDNTTALPASSGMTRRAFLSTTSAVGGAMVVGFWLPSMKAEAQSSAAYPPYREPMVAEINAWLTIAPDDTVTIRVGQTEMGQGVFTNCPLIVAEELQCDWTKVRAEYASANRNVREKAPAWTIPVPGNGNHDPTGGGEPAMLQNANGVYRRMSTNSSGSVREGRYYLQLAGAEARERLLLAAAAEWRVPVSELVAKNSVITHAKSKRQTTYGAMAAKAAAIQLPDPAKTVKLKTPDKFTLYGTEQKDLTTPLKVTGQMMYASDVRLPNMLYAAAKSCPVWGGDVKRFDADKIRNMPGVHSVVKLGPPKSAAPMNFNVANVAGRGGGGGGGQNVPGNFALSYEGHISGGVAVVADTWWHAKQALDAMPIEWEYGPDASVNMPSLIDRHMASLKDAGTVRTNHGDVDAAFRNAATIIEATYTVPYLNHACMEPGGATALVTANRVDLWSGTQTPDSTLQQVAREIGIAPENVYIHTMFLGGGYGIDNSNSRANVQAAAIAKTLNGRPVKLLWSREEDWGFGLRPRPMGVAHFKAAVDPQGWPIAIEVHTAGANYGGDQQWRGLSAWPYFIPNFRFTTHLPKSHVPCVPRRATGSSTNAFYQESFLEELAHAAGKDSYQYRRELIARNPPPPMPGIGGFLQRNDWLKALDIVTKMSEWGKPLPPGWARGLAIDDRRRPSRNSTTAVAQVHTVEVTKRGQIKLHRVDVAFDQGFTFVNPLTVRKQIEGQMAWGYDDAVHQEVTIKDGRAVETNFDSYGVSRMGEYPREVNISFFKSDHWLYGLGEEAIQQVAPAVANAVFKITGKRIRSLPLKNHDLSWG
jgi:isoquinoline 1-oxidoreductase beta subunit